MLTGADVAAHASREDLWMIIDGHAYDLTDFAPSHPGGLKILLKYAGKDATEEYDPIHPKGTIEENLPKDKHLGPVDMSTVTKVEVQEAPTKKQGDLMNLGDCLNLNDIENAAEQRLKPKAWAYYASAADDERTKVWNNTSFSHIRLRPRVLRDVKEGDISTKLLDRIVSMPVFVAPAAMGRLAHNDGEKALARVAAAAEIPYFVSANSSWSFEDIAAAAQGQYLIYQLYVNTDRKKSESQLRRVVKAGYKAICLTVDAPVSGKRERDERATMDADSASDPSMRDATPAEGTINTTSGAASQALAGAMFSYVDPSLSWKDIEWVKRVTGLPVIVKGIQTVDDAILCVKYGAAAIYLSNHGGRQLEGAPSSIETLIEIRKYAPEVLEKVEVYVDGGIRRGTDVIKALALGATAVGVGRPFMMSLIFGDDGVATVANILRNEISVNMRLAGATKVKELVPSMVNTRQLDAISWEGHVDSVSSGGTARAKL